MDKQIGKFGLLVLVVLLLQTLVIPGLLGSLSADEPTSIIRGLCPSAEAANYGKRLIIRNEISMQVHSVNEVKENVRKLFMSKGYIANSNFNIDQSGNSISTISLKVAAEAYPEVRNEIIKLGLVQKEDEQIDDISNQYFDIQTNITTRSNYHRQLVQILASQKKLEIIVDLTELVTSVQTEINKSKGELQRYDNDVKFATIVINLQQTSKVKVINSDIVQIIKDKRPDYIWTVGTAIDEGFYLLKTRVNNTINWLIYQLTANIFGWLVFILIFLILVRFYRDKKLRQSISALFQPKSDENPHPAAQVASKSEYDTTDIDDPIVQPDNYFKSDNVKERNIDED